MVVSLAMRSVIATVRSRVVPPAPYVTETKVGDKGYLLDNIEWVTHSVNSALARPQARKVVSRLYARYGA